MIRRPSAPGRINPEACPFGPALSLLLVLALAGCGSSTATGLPTQPSATSVSQGSAAATVPAQVTSAPTPPPPAASPPAGATPLPTASAALPASAVPTAPTPTENGSAGAEVCSGSAENRSFYASMAAAVDWPVYCPVLPDGWFVQSGQYRLADGGQMEIQYQGPNRAQITLDQGGFCAIQGGCVPSGVDVGPIAFGNREGTLVALDNGSWAVVADRVSRPSWLLEVTGLDDAATRRIAAGLAVVQR